MSSRAAQLRFGVAVVASTLAGALGAGVAPVIVYGLAEYGGFSASAAGAVMSAELAAFAAASLGLARVLGHASRRRFGALGIAVAVIGHLLSAFAAGGPALAAARMVAGFGAGAAAAAASAAAAGARDPDRMFAAVGVVVGLLLGAILTALFAGIEAFGLRFVFLTLAGVCFAALPWVAALPDPDPEDEGERARVRGGERRLALALLLALFLAGVAAQATWSLCGTLGEATGLPNQWLGIVLSGSMVAGLCGAGAATWLGSERGRALPLLGGIAAAAAAMVVIATTRSAALFTVAQLLWGVAYFFSIPYFLGLAAALDARGRWTAAATGVASIGTATAPALAGRVFDAGAGTGLAVLTCICAVGALALLTPVLRRVPLRSGSS